MAGKQSAEMRGGPTAAEFIARRTENKLSQVAAARMLEVSVSTLRAWEYEQNPIPPGYWKLFNLLLQDHTSA